MLAKFIYFFMAMGWNMFNTSEFLRTVTAPDKGGMRPFRNVFNSVVLAYLKPERSA